jgi:hypothetical protein
MATVLTTTGPAVWRTDHRTVHIAIGQVRKPAAAAAAVAASAKRSWYRLAASVSRAVTSSPSPNRCVACGFANGQGGNVAGQGLIQKLLASSPRSSSVSPAGAGQSCAVSWRTILTRALQRRKIDFGAQLFLAAQPAQ